MNRRRRAELDGGRSGLSAAEGGTISGRRPMNRRRRAELDGGRSGLSAAEGGTISGRRPMRPLDGVRVLAAEQMQALPYATQLLARLGGDVVKVEPLGGESGRGSQPA